MRTAKSLWRTRFSNDSDVLYDNLRINLNELSRIRDLFFVVKTGSMQTDERTEAYLIALEGAAPFLETFALFSGLYCDVPEKLFNGIPPPRLRVCRLQAFQIPEVLFQGIPPPGLKELYLDDGYIPASSCLLRAQLTTLDLSICNVGDKSLLQTIQVLSHLPTLEILILKSLHPYQPLPSFLPSVALPHLRDLCIHELFGEFVLIILDHLSLPIQTNLEISFVRVLNNLNDESFTVEFLDDLRLSLMRKLASFVDAGGRYSFLRVSYRDFDPEDDARDDGFTVQASGPYFPDQSDEVCGTEAPADQQLPTAGQLTVSCPFDHFDTDPDDVFTPIVESLLAFPAFSHGIRTVDISYDICFEHSCWECLDWELENISTLSVNGHSVYGLFTALEDGPGLFCNVKVLSLTTTDFCGWFPNTHLKTSLGKLNLHTLRISDSSIKQQQVQTCRSVVDHFYWDGKEDGFVEPSHSSS
ncbi:hypothetical protein K488DRAFT_83963 [Vararia minispora EC-137]|uniref:Uncharacterized protein n=1 Tax=Vararia minispora EC-137 TaxID=1314806 RepID=A0ACB8QRE0_9AGAM|nr:hypothetical protein K488DRAFT_83963 [Vararia minispora EC-137]